MHYKRILLKLSGEALQGDQGYGICPKVLDSIALQVKEVWELGVEIAIVIGGGNIFRGLKASSSGMDRATADYMGMLGTVINALALKEAIEKHGRPARVMSALDIESVAEPFIRARALRHFDKGRVLILAAGTGNPFFTTDTCASLRAIELDADILLKATNVDGVYDADPNLVEDATRFERLTFAEAINKQLGVMDLTALSMCMEHDLPVVVFNFKTDGNICRVISGESIGTIVTNEKTEMANSQN